MRFGNISQFAIEFELDEQYGGEWLYGKFCYWINNKRIGNYDLGTSLRDILFSMRTVLISKGNRSHQSLFQLEKVELFRRINDVLYGYERTKYDEIANEEGWMRFNITLPVDVFDNWKLFIVENSESARIIYRHPDILNEIVYEAIINKGVFDEIIEDAYKKLNSIYSNEMIGKEEK